MQPASKPAYRSAIGRPLIFECPKTLNNVQHWLDGDDAPDHTYESVVCPACTGLHFINGETGKLLGQGERESLYQTSGHEKSTPRDLAVFRFRMNSPLVTCSTGRSAGLSPLRILPTRIPTLRYTRRS